MTIGGAGVKMMRRKRKKKKRKRRGDGVEWTLMSDQRSASRDLGGRRKDEWEECRDYACGRPYFGEQSK